MIGINILGEIKIYKNESGYYTAIKNKNKDGEYDKMYVDVYFKNGIMESEIPNNTNIQIIKGFLSFYKTKTGQAKIKLIIQEYQELFTEKEDSDDSELPF